MSGTQKIVKNASIMAAATFLSRLLGFVRDAVVAFALGAGPLADAFFVAFRLPNLFRRLFAEGSLTLAFIPVFTQTRQEEDDRDLPPALRCCKQLRPWCVSVFPISFFCPA